MALAITGLQGLSDEWRYCDFHLLGGRRTTSKVVPGNAVLGLRRGLQGLRIALHDRASALNEARVTMEAWVAAG